MRVKGSGRIGSACGDGASCSLGC
uniref:Envelope glycoprotein n=1 Tax=Human immunodeficiency virus type 1 TaxID=11676 RepID=H6CVB5_HV1|nr:envelope glycoprotein [Human immunodeficiency virus 1]